METKNTEAVIFKYNKAKGQTTLQFKLHHSERHRRITQAAKPTCLISHLLMHNYQASIGMCVSDRDCDVRGHG